MKFGKWIVITIAVLLLCLPSTVFAGSARGDAVSPALLVLAHKNTMAKSCVQGEEIGFVAEDFEKALNVSSVASITITELPERSDGILYLGGSEVTVGQTVSRANISYLTFVFMNEDISDSAFRFSTNHGDYDISCAVYRLKYENRSPVVSSVPQEIVSVSTYKGIDVYGNLDAYDPDGDEIRYEIVSYPQNGSLILLDCECGEYRYLPANGFAGEDTFRYVAVDRYGNYSASVQVTLTVAQPKTAFVYSDLKESKAHVAAISLTERGIMASSELDGCYYFYPETELTRAEFLVMAMKTFGIRVDSNAEETVFADNGEIPREYRGYVDFAQKLGYVCGRLDSENQLVFCPNEKITRYEAAVMLCQMFDAETPVLKPMLMDAEVVPAWAMDAVYAMTAAGILTSEEGYVEADAVVTRAQAAQMLYKLSIHGE